MALPNPIVEGNTLVIPAIQSDNFQADTSIGVGAATQGWQIARDGTATFTNLNLLGDIGAGNISGDLGIFSDIELPNYDSLDTTLDSIVNDLSGRCVGFFQQTDAALTGITGENVIIGLDVFLQPNRIYTLNGMARVQPSLANADTQWQALIRATIGPGAAVPTTANSPIAQHVGSLWQQAPLHTPPFNSGAIPADTPLRMILTVNRISGGSGAATMGSGGNQVGTLTVSGVTYTFRYPGAALWVLDHGPSTNMPAFTGYNSTDTPPVTPNPPSAKTYTKTYYATWSRTYDGDNTTTWDDTAYCYQGYYSSDRGHTKSLVGFDYATIASDLSGAVINSCYVTVKAAHSYYNDGYALDVGTHNYTAKPSTWNGANVNEQRTGINRPPGIAAGETKKISLGTTIGGEFKSQVSRGIAFGPGLNNQLVYYGYLYGYGQSGRPYLTITYTK